MKSSRPNPSVRAATNPSRRAMLALLAAMPAGRALARDPLPSTRETMLAQPSDGWTAEAQRLAAIVQATFWDADRNHYVAPHPYSGTVRAHDRNGPFHGHTVWSWCEAFRMLAALVDVDPDRWRAPLHDVYAALEQFYDPDRHLYTAWVRFPGNVDSYSDDNAWLVMGFCEATHATGDRRFAERGREVMNGYIATEWRDDDGPLGMRWGYDVKGGSRRNQRAAISASTSAVAALRLAELDYDVEQNRERAKMYLDWVEATCVDDEGLVMDGLQPGRGEDGGWGLERTRWSYNTGLFLIGLALLHRQTGDADALARLKRSADAAIDREGRLWDEAVNNPDRRHLRGKTFFVPHLLEALVIVGELTGEAKYRQVAEREAAYLYTYLRDPADGLYYRNGRLHAIGPTQRDRFKRDFADAYDPAQIDGGYESDERVSGNGPAASRPFAKTLLSAAAVAHGYAVLGKA